MTIPDSTPDAVIEAMRRFDKDFRDTAEWQKWKENANYKYAIEYEERLYPVKKILSLATGVPVNEFSGGAVAND
jgi:5-methylcytosine-specific restriction enzyme B